MINLILILGDQLSDDITSLAKGDKTNDVVLICEVMEEATYVKHHKKKIAFLFSAMRHFAAKLKEDGWSVDYVKIDDPQNTGSLGDEVKRAAATHGSERLLITEPGEWRLREDIKTWEAELSIPVEILPDHRFIASHSEFQTWAKDRKQLRMEYFYRDMRRKTGLLMDGDEPEGGKWNFDSENRKPAKNDLFIPAPLKFEPDQITAEVAQLVIDRFPDHIGKLDEFWFAVTDEQANSALEHFVQSALPLFGDYQDAMLTGEKFLYHSVLSAYINCGLLDPLKVCQRIETEYRKGTVPLNAAEGFIRQIIGWREYVRGIYWLKMPEYRDLNFFECNRSLPLFYWTGDTDLQCLKEAIGQTIDEAYAHHIQRLMVTGNFAMLIGADPHEVHEWYLAVYADAYEWVELPNTLGMSQFGDGGLLGSKPYAASGNYINKMSDYCKSCRYDVKLKTGENACPFNALYWDFLERNRPKLNKNPRLGQVYRTWDKMDDVKKQEYLGSAAAFLAKLN